MPSPLTSSFASAAANNNQDGRRGDSVQDWSRSRANGATQTFRRTSQATNPSSNRDSSHFAQSNSAPNSTVYVPPHMNATNQSSSLRNGSMGEVRYSKEQMVELYKHQRQSEALDQNLSAIFTGGWNPLDARDATSSGWGRRDEGKESTVGPEICWHHRARTQPLALAQVTDEERELFSASVNSPIKLPQSSTKDNTTNNTVGRRTSASASQNHAGTGSGASIATGRGSLRRRETSDSHNPLSPLGGGRFFRDEPNMAEPPASLLRRKTDYREEADDAKSEEKHKDTSTGNGRDGTNSSFGSLKRTTTGPSTAGLNGPSSPWTVGPPSAALGSMGTFGSFAIGPSMASNDASEPRSPFGKLWGESRFKGLMTASSAEDISTVAKKSSLSNLQRLPEVQNDSSYRNWEDPLRNRPGRSDTNPYDDVARSGSAALIDVHDDGQDIDLQASSASGLPSITGARDFLPTSVSQDLPFHQTPQARQRGQEPMSPTNTNPYQSPEADRSDADQENASNQTQQRAMFGFASREEPGANVFGGVPRGVSSAMDDRSQTSSAGGARGFGGLAGLGGGFPTFGSSAWTGLGGTSSNKERGGFPSGFGDSVFGTGDRQSPGIAGLGSNSAFISPPVQNLSATGRSSRLDVLLPHGVPDQIRLDKPGADGMERQTDFATRSRGISGLDGAFTRREHDHLRATGGFFGDSRSHEPSLRSLHGVEDDGLVEGRGPPRPGSGFVSSQNIITSPGLAQATNAAASGDMSMLVGQNPSQSSDSLASAQLPPAQQRQMVMPDRMRWIYRDPSGMTQGPWSGLEMHDWFKAGFFTAELQVKKLEDTEYEPLAQLVRRIGNSREPFLVPQIGVPHGGAAAPSQGNQWASPSTSSAVGTGAHQPGAAQPPFASSFPSFGTTLTAEQQNALERRKQEEQYLMARQKEHLAQQQVLLKQMQLQGGPHSLHSLQHHSSAHSLHSQPSFGSITSPSGYQPSPVQGPIQPPQNGPGFIEGSTRPPPSSQLGGDLRGGREDDLPNLLERMNISRGAPFPFSSAPFGQQPDSHMPPPQISAMLQDRARLLMEQQQQQQQQQADPRGKGDAFHDTQALDERLGEFNALRSQMQDDEVGMNQDIATMQMRERAREYHSQHQEQLTPLGMSAPVSTDAEGLSITQQVQNTAAAMSQQSTSRLEGGGWNKYDTELPSMRPPTPTGSPLPAPSAQRNRQNVADNLAAESQRQTPVDAPSASSVAPWADKTSEGTKGPSLRQIQEAEARRAAQQEDMAAAARRAQIEQAPSVQPVAAAPALPNASNWAANAGSPTTPTTSSANVWAKRAVLAPASVATNTTAKKTLAQIQREEEARKQRQAAVVNQQSANVTAAANVGKRYADLASKAATTGVLSAPLPPTGAWTTVGSGGRAKAPSAVVATPQASARTVSGTSPAASTAATRLRPTVQTRLPSITTTTNQTKAAEDFTRWAKAALAKGLNSSINAGTISDGQRAVDDFVQSLVLLPAEAEIISDSIYANSQILDGRRFAEEFLRHRKLADKGLLQDGSTPLLANNVPISIFTSNNNSSNTVTTTSNNTRSNAMFSAVGGAGGAGSLDEGTAGGERGGGWSEVAKKGQGSHNHHNKGGGVGGQGHDSGTNSTTSAAFKVVAPKKKGKR